MNFIFYKKISLIFTMILINLSLLKYIKKLNFYDKMNFMN